jgi:hypothetical protein
MDYPGVIMSSLDSAKSILLNIDLLITRLQYSQSLIVSHIASSGNSPDLQVIDEIVKWFESIDYAEYLDRESDNDIN